MHPGSSNSHEVKAGTKLAILYDDISVLENHHTAMTFDILGRPGCNVLETLTPSHTAQIFSGSIEDRVAEYRRVAGGV